MESLVDVHAHTGRRRSETLNLVHSRWNEETWLMILASFFSTHVPVTSVFFRVHCHSSQNLNTFCFFLWTQNFFVPYSARMRPAFQASPLDEDHLNSDKHLERSEVSIHGKPVRACTSRIITSWSCVTIPFFGMFYSCIRKSECAAEPTEKIMQPESHLSNMFSKTAKVGWLWELSWIDHQLKCFAACLSSPQLRVK
jgi:hypothetical protein